VNLLTGTSDIDGGVLSVVNPETSLTTTGGLSLALGTDYTVTGSTFDLTAAGIDKFRDLPEGTSDTFVFDFGVTDTHATTSNTLSVTIEGASYAITRVGYYDTTGSGQPYEATPIVDAGLTAVRLFSLDPTSLAGVDAVVVYSSSSFSYVDQFPTPFGPFLQQFVADGGVAVFFDRTVTGATSFLPGFTGDEIIVQDFFGGGQTQLDFLNDTGQFAVGPGGTLNDMSLDGGNSSNHGYAFADTLGGLVGLHVIQTTNNPNEATTFGYHYGQGEMIYSTIPLDFWLSPPFPGSGNPTLEAHMEDYATNVMAWLASGADLPLA
jgi:hypothetical protein